MEDRIPAGCGPAVRPQPLEPAEIRDGPGVSFGVVGRGLWSAGDGLPVPGAAPVPRDGVAEATDPLRRRNVLRDGVVVRCECDGDCEYPSGEDVSVPFLVCTASEFRLRRSSDRPIASAARI